MSNFANGSCGAAFFANTRAIPIHLPISLLTYRKGDFLVRAPVLGAENPFFDMDPLASAKKERIPERDALVIVVCPEKIRDIL